jgi:hypothetical protein
VTSPYYAAQPPPQSRSVPPPPPQPSALPTDAVVGALVSAILAGWALNRIMALFKNVPGVTPEAVRYLSGRTEFVQLVKLPDLSYADDPAANQRTQNAYRRATYMVQAALRMSTALSTPGDPQARADAVRRAWATEVRYMQQHLQAQARRNMAAQQVARVWRANKKPALLGWKAKMDERTTAECRAANGRNFDPRKIPTIGYPGTVHPHCRCVPVKPYDTTLRVEDLWVGMPGATSTVAASNPDYNSGDVWMVVRDHPYLPRGVAAAVNLSKARWEVQ